MQMTLLSRDVLTVFDLDYAFTQLLDPMPIKERRKWRWSTRGTMGGWGGGPKGKDGCVWEVERKVVCSSQKCKVLVQKLCGPTLMTAIWTAVNK